MKLHFLTYADIRFHKAKERLLNEARNFGEFDVITGLGPEDLSGKILELIEPIKNSRGGGYYLWKPYIILEYMKEKMDRGDVLVFLDAGCTLNPVAKDRFRWYIQSMMASGAESVVFQLKHMEYKYTVEELFQHLGVPPESDIRTSCQYISGIQIIKKGPISMKVFEKAVYDVAFKNYKLYTDDYNQRQKNSEFIENRHDQSVLSVLHKQIGSCIVIPDETYIPELDDKYKYPFWATRLRT